MKQPLQSSIFSLVPLHLSTGTELILEGGRHLFDLLPAALDGFKKIVVVGWGKQAPAQTPNIRDSLLAAGSNISVSVVLRANSKSRTAARECGFTEETGTLGTAEELIPDADLVLFLIADGDQPASWKHITNLMKPGSTLGFSHGFLIGHLYGTGEKIRDDINIIMVAPKGVGDSVRDLYLQGANINGAGINSSVAIYQEIDAHALDRALGWSIAIGSPVTFFTTMEKEVISDLTGERCALL